MGRKHRLRGVGIVDLDELKNDVDLRAIVGSGYHRCPWRKERTPSLYVYEDHVHCFGCGRTADGLDFLQAYLKISFYAAARLMNQFRGTRVPEEDKPLEPLPWENVSAPVAALWSDRGQEARDWLAARGIQEIIARAVYLGWDGRAITIPYIKDHQVYNIKRRILDDYRMDQEPKYRGLPRRGFPGLYPQDYLDQNGRGGPLLVLTEGEFDALVFLQEGIPSLSLPSGVNSAPRYAEYLQQFELVLIAFDQDVAGQRAADALERKKDTLGINLQVLRWPPEWGKDVSDARDILLPRLQHVIETTL